MQAIVASVTGAVFAEFEQPCVIAGSVLVKVKAAALNRADLMMATGGAHGAVGGIGLPLGLEWAGEVIAVGEGVHQWQVGDRVMGASPAAFAEYVLVNADWIYAIPECLSDVQAAALPVSMQTMHDALISHGQLMAGQCVLIQGASSAMGLMGLQLAQYWGAAQVIGTSTSPERRQRLSAFGADLVLDSRASDWTQQVLKATRRKGVDLVIDLLAGSTVNASLSVTRVGGRMVNVGRMAGESGDFDFDLHSMRRISYVGVSFRTRTALEITQVIERARQDLMPALMAGQLSMPIDVVVPWTAYPRAFAQMVSQAHFGKIVLDFQASN